MPNIEGTPGYLIFFDNVRIDPFVNRFSTAISNDGNISRASIDMIYIHELNRIERRSSTANYEDSIDNMTNCKIFIKNIFNNKYSIVFDGNIRGKSFEENPNGNSLSYHAIDFMEASSKTIAPLSVPIFNNSINPIADFKLLAQGINTSNIPNITTSEELKFREKTLSEIVEAIKSKAIKNNAIYRDMEGVSYWNDLMGRIQLMGDINPLLRETEILDNIININTLSAESVYIILNDILQKLMFEFYQDKDGVIRIKPPFWNEPVLKNHILDSSMILSTSGSSSWERQVSRVLTTGGVENIYYQSVRESELLERSLVPIGVYKGNVNNAGTWISAENPSRSAVINPTNFERRYGHSVYSNTQPLIRFNIDILGDRKSTYNALESYSRFMFDLLNSMVDVASVSTIAAPWMRPGVNCWISPSKQDKVYYVNGVSHNGSADGVYTTLNLVYGRDSRVFFEGDQNIFGTLKNRNDNMFVNQITRGVETFGPVISSLAMSQDIKTKSREFNSINNETIIKANQSAYLVSLYGGSPVKNTSLGGLGQLTSSIFEKDMAADEIQTYLNKVYSAAPIVVKNRIAKIEYACDRARTTMAKQFVVENI